MAKTYSIDYTIDDAWGTLASGSVCGPFASKREAERSVRADLKRDLKRGQKVTITSVS